mmetsp:Transcript_68048/g.79160  ORF Transcript_68048/g.79160 Transcript_68048/m.79160 type:complete len:202 (-) Transcript_68048:24-629(-)
MFASPPFVMKIFDPFSTYESPFFSARVFSANASLPLDGSVRQKHPIVSCASRGRYFAFCAAFAYRKKMLFTSVFCTSIITDVAPSTRASCSIARMLPKNDIPLPCRSAGVSMPIRPALNASWITTGSIFAASSIFSTRGCTCCSANSRTDDCSIFSSSVSVVHGAGSPGTALHSIGTLRDSRRFMVRRMVAWGLGFLVAWG